MATPTPSLKREYRQMQAARAMLAALEGVIRREDEAESTSNRDLLTIRETITQAKAAGITATEGE